MKFTFLLLFLLKVYYFKVSSATEPSCLKEFAFVPSELAMRFIGGLTSPFVQFEEFLVDYFEKQPMVLRRRKTEFYSSMLDIGKVDDIITKGRHPNNISLPIIYGVDWKLIRRMARDGEWWSGMPPKTNFLIEEAHHAFRRGFTILINKVGNFEIAIARIQYVVSIDAISQC